MAPHDNCLKDYHKRLNRMPVPEAPAKQAHTSLTAKRSIHDERPAHCAAETATDPAPQHSPSRLHLAFVDHDGDQRQLRLPVPTGTH